MGLIDRLNRVTSARLEAFLYASERPEEVLPGLMREMELQAQLTVRAVAKALASVRAAQSRLDEAEGRIGRLEKGAGLALAAGDEELAREALAEAVRAGKERECILAALTPAQLALDHAREAQLRIQGQLEQLRLDGCNIVARARASAAGSRIHARTSFSGGAGNILDRVASIEVELDKDEAEIEIRRAASSSPSASLEERLRDMELRAEIERRINDLKKHRQRF